MRLIARKVETTTPEELARMKAKLAEVSKRQFRDRSRPGAAMVWEGEALFCALPVLGEYRYLPARVCLTDDGLFYCASQDRALFWCASVLAPNRVRLRRRAFWVAGVDGRDDDVRFGRFHPLMVHFIDPRIGSTPYVGGFAMLKAARRVAPLEVALRRFGVSFK